VPGAAPRAFHARVTGRVQGVGFRWSAVREARRLGLRGWVRNADDGSVEVEAEGPPAAIEGFLAWLRRGPAGAFVSGVEAHPVPPDGTRGEFDVEF
jgi:acylphosphatase